jgi:hypothetical protein
VKELFQLGQPDLDFGLYRIMHARTREISQFLDRDLLPQVQATLYWMGFIGGALFTQNATSGKMGE